MKVLVTGVAGQLGYDVMNELRKRGHETIGTDIKENQETDFSYVCMDITNETLVKDVIHQILPQAIVH